MRARRYYCRVSGMDHWGESIVNALNVGSAKADYWRQVRDAWPDIPYTAIRCRVGGTPESSRDFIACATSRGFPDARCGMWVVHPAGKGVILGHDRSANFVIAFGEDSRYPGQTLSVHPSEITLLSGSSSRADST